MSPLNTFDISNTFEVRINGVDVTKYAVYPINIQYTLDDALDQAYIELRNTNVPTAYKPFSRVELTISAHQFNGPETSIFYVAVDNCVLNQKTGRADHRILLSEETKILERVICRAKTFVKPLVKNYHDNNVKAYPQTMNTSDVVTLYNANFDFYYPRIHTPVESDDPYATTEAMFTAAPIQSVLYVDSEQIKFSKAFVPITDTGYTDITPYMRLIVAYDVNNNIVAFSSDYDSGSSSRELSLRLPEVGSYTVYVFAAVSYRYNTNYGYYNFAAKYYVSAMERITVRHTDLYITDVVNELLEIAEPIHVNEAPRFTLYSSGDLYNPGDAERYATTPCAELNFANGASLWENLLEIGKIIHCIPRLKNDVLYFDKLGSNEVFYPSSIGKPISANSDFTAEKYATHLDSSVNGLMNLDDINQGSIEDPFIGGFRTLRSDTTTADMRTTVDSALIRTVEPIEKMIKVTVLYNGTVYDITPFVYEKSEYDLLYSNEASFPYSKAFALYYVQGQPNIYGLTYKEDNPVSEVFERFSIENILTSVTSTDVNLGSNGWSVLLGSLIKGDAGANSLALLNLAFNVEYVTFINGRVRQAKRSLDDHGTTAALAYNQSARKLSSVNFGKRLKGEMAMMGSDEVKVCFKTNNWDSLSKAVGKVYGDDTYGKNMFISSVTAKIWREYIIAELSLTKNFNQLGRFVSINSAVRQFEIDTNVSETYCLEEEYLVFSETQHNHDTSAIANGDTIAHSVQFVLTGQHASDDNQKVSLAFTYTLADDYSGITATYLPVQSVALGNSLLFNFRYADNYSAGESLNAVDNKGYKLSVPIRYGDPLYGEAKYLRAHLLNNVWFPGVDNVALGDSLPLVTYMGNAQAVAVTNNNGKELIVNKSSRDALNYTYQMHFVTDSGFIFGEQLLQANPLVGGEPISIRDDAEGRPAIYFYDSRVNEITGEPDDIYGDKGSAYLNYTVYNGHNGHYGAMTLYGSAPQTYESWVIRDLRGNILLAKNGEFNGIYYYVKRKIN